jgi:PAS domain S-box-containing protein
MADAAAATAPRWRTALACGLAAAATVAVFLGRQYLPGGFGEPSLLALFMLPILASALLGGFMPCAVATAVAALLTSGLVLKAGAGAYSGDAADLLQWSVLVGCGLLASAAQAVRQRSRRREALQRQELAAAQQRLLHSDARFQATFEQAAAGIAMVATDGRWLRVNRRLCAIVGYTADELMATNFQQITHPDDLKADLDLLRQLLAGEIQTYALEKRYLRKDGAEVWVRLAVVLVRTATGVPDYFVAVIEDNSARRRAEDALRESEVRYRTAFLTGPDAININRLPDGLYIDVNERFLRMSGWTRDEVIGRTSSEINIWRNLEDRRRMVDMLQRSGSCENLEAEFVMRDGSVLTGLLSAHVITVGGERCTLSITRDITERKRIEIAMRRSEQRASDLIDGAMDAIISVGTDQRIVRFNRAAERVFGIGAEAAMGSSIERFIPPSLRARHAELVESYAANGRTERHMAALPELTGLRADGSEFQFEATLSRIDTDDGPQMTVMLRDVTELKAAREERAAHEARTEFLSRVSHELRTPLNAILGFAQLLRLDRSALQSPVQRAHLERIHQSGEHLLALVNDVLDLSRIEAGQMRLSIEAVNLAALTEECQAMLAGLAAAREVVMATRASSAAQRGLALDPRAASTETDAPGVPWVQADRLRLKQVLLNLLSNAIKYNRPGGEVALSWRADGGQWQLRIADTGRGMTAEQLAHLFEPFNRLGVERSRIEGTGIGLVVARGLTELMGGQLNVDSTAGRGTVITLSLRSTLERDETDPEPAWHLSATASLDGGIRVLYAEDDEVNVELVRAIMAKRAAVTLEIAVSGAEALAAARRDPPDLLLLDMHLGDMTGLEVARTLMDDPITRRIPLVAMSADAMPEQIDAALAQGFAAYLTKPIDVRALLQLIDTAAAGQGS